MDSIERALGWFVILVLVWLFVKPYVMIFVLSGKNRKGIPISLSPEQIVQLLENRPWCDHQNVHIEIATIPGTQLQSQIRLNGICSEIYLYIENGTLHGHGYTARKPVEFRRLYLVQNETQQLLQYIACYDRLDDASHEMAAQLREKNRRFIAKRDNYDKFILFCGILVLIAVVIFVIVRQIPSKDYSPSANVKGAVFTDFDYTDTIGTVLDSFDPDGEWFDISAENALKKDGVAYAGWRGSCGMANLLDGSNNQPIELDFKVELTDSDKVRISIDKIQFMDQYYFSSRNTYQNAVIANVLDMIYGNTQYVEVTLDMGIITPTYYVTWKYPAAPGTEELNVEGRYDNFVGNWQDLNGYGNYLFIGYSDETKQHAYAYVATARKFEVELTSEDGESASGCELGGGSEPLYGIDLVRVGYKLEANIYFSDDNSGEYIIFVPSDPDTCPYENPYYVG